MSDNEENGGVEIPSEGRYPTVNEQMDIINGALDACLEKVSQGRWRYHRYHLHSAYVFGEASYSVYQDGVWVDGYVGRHPLVWFLDGTLTPQNLKETIHRVLDVKGF